MGTGPVSCPSCGHENPAAPPRLPEHLAALTAKTERLLLEVDDLKTEEDRRRFKDNLGRLHQHHWGFLLEIGRRR